MENRYGFPQRDGSNHTMDVASENSALVSFSSSGEGSQPQDCIPFVNKDDLSSRDHQKYYSRLNTEDLCCFMPSSMSQFFGGQ